MNDSREDMRERFYALLPLWQRRAEEAAAARHKKTFEVYEDGKMVFETARISQVVAFVHSRGHPTDWLYAPPTQYHPQGRRIRRLDFTSFIAKKCLREGHVIDGLALRLREN